MASSSTPCPQEVARCSRTAAAGSRSSCFSPSERRTLTSAHRRARRRRTQAPNLVAVRGVRGLSENGRTHEQHGEAAGRRHGAKKDRTGAGRPGRAITWKPLKPGRYNGYWESYKNEIAAYEFDKLLGLDMVPPYVERRVNGDLGAADVARRRDEFQGTGRTPAAPPQMAMRWAVQIMKAKMYAA